MIATVTSSETWEGKFSSCFSVRTRKENHKTSGLDFQTLRIGNPGPKHFQELFCWFMADSALTPKSLKFSLLYSLYPASQTQMTPELGNSQWVDDSVCHHKK